MDAFQKKPNKTSIIYSLPNLLTPKIKVRYRSHSINEVESKKKRKQVKLPGLSVKKKPQGCDVYEKISKSLSRSENESNHLSRIIDKDRTKVKRKKEVSDNIKILKEHCKIEFDYTLQTIVDKTGKRERYLSLKQDNIFKQVQFVNSLNENTILRFKHRFKEEIKDFSMRSKKEEPEKLGLAGKPIELTNQAALKTMQYLMNKFDKGKGKLAKQEDKDKIKRATSHDGGKRIKSLLVK